MEKKRYHFTEAYLLNPVHPINVTLIGAGGNGSQMLSVLARMHISLIQMGHPGLYVSVFDQDVVERTNIGRQLFTAADLGFNKANCLVSRFNRIYGLNWKAVPYKWTSGHNTNTNIIITCVDNIKTRLDVGKAMKNEKKKLNTSPEYRTYYWLDLGNAQKTGQVILGSSPINQPKSKKFDSISELPLVTDMHDLTQQKDEDSGPSCSLAEALEKQDLFINSTLAQAAGSLLWNLIRGPYIETRGFYLNLEKMRMNPVNV